MSVVRRCGEREERFLASLGMTPKETEQEKEKRTDLKVGRYKAKKRQEGGRKQNTTRRGRVWISGSYEEDVPEDVYAGVDQGGGEDGVGFAPGPSVEEAGDGG